MEVSRRPYLVMSFSKSKELNVTKKGEDYAKRLENLYIEITSVPHFNDKEVFLDSSGISFFHKESQKEIAWTIAVCLQIFQKENMQKVSHVLTNKTFKVFAETTEAILENRDTIMLTRDAFGVGKLIVSDKKEEE
tara:strand:- start:22 stop:426 length:405 start_codon:yes stop_codon:yes gene_type:complete